MHFQNGRTALIVHTPLDKLIPPNLKRRSIESGCFRCININVSRGAARDRGLSSILFVSEFPTAGVEEPFCPAGLALYIQFFSNIQHPVRALVHTGVAAGRKAIQKVSVDFERSLTN
jgi:hypothetical protein